MRVFPALDDIIGGRSMSHLGETSGTGFVLSFGQLPKYLGRVKESIVAALFGPPEAALFLPIKLLGSVRVHTQAEKKPVSR